MQRKDMMDLPAECNYEDIDMAPITAVKAMANAEA